MLMISLAEIYKAAAELYAEGHENLQDVMADISNVARRLTEAETNITGMISKPNNGMVYWIEVQPNGNRLSLNAAPLSVAPLVEKYLWHEKRSVILTSATLDHARRVPVSAQHTGRGRSGRDAAWLSL